MLKRVKRINRKIRNFINLKLKQKVTSLPCLKFGTEGCDWFIPKHLLNSNSLCYLAGAGENITFDTQIVEKYGCKVYIFDPTPRAKQHYNILCESIKNGKILKVDKNEFYKLSLKNLEKIEFLEIGLWEFQDIIKFYKPSNPNYVSHSILNLQKTSDFIEAPVDRLSNLMKKLKHKEIDLLKLDIEGAEYKVIDTIIADKLTINAICIEFDEIHSPADNKYLSRILACIAKLRKAGYEIVKIDYKYNFTFVKQELITSLKRKS